MEPKFGWTLLSREALRQAESHLNEDVMGVRDEIGFLSLHQAYADRFFPGTSVQHTRLRYLLFVPWLYMDLADQRVGGRIEDALEAAEIKITGRLKKSDQDGIIGTRSFPDPTSQPPSLVYWSALGTWQILRPMRDGTHLTRSNLHRLISRVKPAGRIRDDDKVLLEEREHIFAQLPSPPKNWADSKRELTFSLTKRERRFLKGVILALSRPTGSSHTPPLISRLVEKGTQITKTTKMWSSKILNAADQDDRQALLRARKVSHLSAIGRAVYAALVEEIRVERDGNGSSNLHRETLATAIEKYRDSALSLDVEEIQLDTNVSIERILEVLRATQVWLRSHKLDIGDLYDVFCDAERKRKGKRARLPMTLLAKEKRAEWQPEKHTEAKPLHFRWQNVRNFLIDLGEA